MASYETVFDHYVAHILSGLIACEGVEPAPLGPSQESEYERMVGVAFAMADIVMEKRQEWGLE
jgi:hypothetical protein